MCREYTKTEMREKFLNSVRNITEYWATTELDSENDNVKYRCEGVAFSLMVLLDGGSGGSPGYLIISTTHPDDKEYHIKRKENYYPDTTNEMENADIGDALHEEL